MTITRSKYLQECSKSLGQLEPFLHEDSEQLWWRTMLGVSNCIPGPKNPCSILEDPPEDFWTVPAPALVPPQPSSTGESPQQSTQPSLEHSDKSSNPPNKRKRTAERFYVAYRVSGSTSFNIGELANRSTLPNVLPEEIEVLKLQPDSDKVYTRTSDTEITKISRANIIKTNVMLTKSQKLHKGSEKEILFELQKNSQ